MLFLFLVVRVEFHILNLQNLKCVSSLIRINIILKTSELLDLRSLHSYLADSIPLPHHMNIKYTAHILNLVILQLPSYAGHPLPESFSFQFLVVLSIFLREDFIFLTSPHVFCQSLLYALIYQHSL